MLLSRQNDWIRSDQIDVEPCKSGHLNCQGKGEAGGREAEEEEEKVEGEQGGKLLKV